MPIFRPLMPLALLLLALPLRAQEQPPQPDAEVALQRKLDSTINLKIDKPIAEVFKQIAATAGISLQVDPACYDLLPYGATTNVSADFRNSKLRDSIEGVLVTLGLTQTVSGSTVIIRPAQPLLHLGRRATLDELKLLQDLRTNDLKPNDSGSIDWTSAIRTALDRQSIAVAQTDPTGPAQDKALDQIKKQLPMSPFRALELYTSLTNQIWLGEIEPSTGTATIRIMSPKKWIQRQLERPVLLNFTNAPLAQVVAELSHLSGIRFVPEPGLYQAIPTVSLNSTNGTVLQSLEALAGATRIAFDLREDSVLLHLSPGPGAVNTPKADAIVARVALPVPNAPGMNMDIFLHESDLSPALNDLRKQRLQEAVQLFEKSLASPPTPPALPTPETNPATQPTAQK